MGLLGLLRRKKKGTPEPVEELQPEDPAGPELFVLVPEVAGAATYQVNRFHSADEAIEFIVPRRAQMSAQGAHVFWALHNDPPPNTPRDSVGGEALVLICSGLAEDMVHVVSFVDIESAQSFARFEVRRGLDLSLLMIHWAAFVQVIDTPFGLRLDPVEAPVYESLPQTFAAAPTTPAPPAEISVAEDGDDPELRVTPEPEPLIEDPAFDETTPESEVVAEPSVPVEPAVEAETVAEAEADAEPVEVAEASSENVPEPIVVPEREEEMASDLERSDTEIAIEPAETAPPHAEDETEPEAEPEDEVAEPARELEKPDESEPIEVAAESIAIEVPEPTIEQGPAVPSANDVETGGAALESEGPVEQELTSEVISVSGDEEIAGQFIREALGEADVTEAGSQSDEEAEPVEEPMEKPDTSTPEDVREEANVGGEPETREPAEAGAVAGSTSDSASESSSSGEEDGVSDDAAEEIEKILKVKRWEKKDTPFSGFDSPPGRF